MIKNFACFKTLEKKEGQPDYRLTANIGTKDEPKYVDVGAGWIKEGNKGKFISFTLSKPYGDRPGFTMVQEEGTVTEKVDYPEGPDGEIPF